MRHGNMQLIRPSKFWNFIVKKKTLSFDSFYGYYVLVLFFETYTILKCEMISFQRYILHIIQTCVQKNIESQNVTP